MLAQSAVSRIYARRSDCMHPDQMMLERMAVEHAEQGSSLEPLTEVPESSLKPKAISPKRNHPDRLPIPERLVASNHRKTHKPDRRSYCSIPDSLMEGSPSYSTLKRRVNNFAKGIAGG